MIGSFSEETLIEDETPGRGRRGSRIRVALKERLGLSEAVVHFPSVSPLLVFDGEGLEGQDAAHDPNALAPFHRRWFSTDAKPTSEIPRSWK
jgi:hypothetical protein